MPILTTKFARGCLRSAFKTARTRWPFTIPAIVLLPDHLHVIWILPDGDSAFSTRWAWIKREFTRNWLAGAGIERTTTRSKQSERRRGVWQRRFWEHTIRNETDFQHHCDYIHYNPVKRGLTRCPQDWPYSSFQRFVRTGDYSPSWGCAESPVPTLGDLDEDAIE